MDLKNKILERAREDFFKWGIRNVSMDQLAEELGISKRTLYEIFKSKDEIVLATIRDIHVHISQVLNQYIQEMQNGTYNSIEVLCLFASSAVKERRKITPFFFSDICKYYPQISETSYAELENLTRQKWFLVYRIAQKEGFLRKELNVELIHLFFYDMVTDKFRYVSSGRCSTKEMHTSIINPLVRGCFTPKGRRVLMNFLHLCDDDDFYTEILNKLNI